MVRADRLSSKRIDRSQSVALYLIESIESIHRARPIDPRHRYGSPAYWIVLFQSICPSLLHLSVLRSRLGPYRAGPSTNRAIGPESCAPSSELATKPCLGHPVRSDAIS